MKTMSNVWPIGRVRFELSLFSMRNFKEIIFEEKSIWLQKIERFSKGNKLLFTFRRLEARIESGR